LLSVIFHRLPVCFTRHTVAVTKRIGYLVELLQITGLDPFVDFAKKQVNNKYNLFDPQGLEEGEFVSAWQLRLNISRSSGFVPVKLQIPVWIKVL